MKTGCDELMIIMPEALCCRWKPYSWSRCDDR